MAVAHGAHPRKLPQEWGHAAKRELLNSRDATPRRHRLPTLVGLHLQMLRKVSRSSPESSRFVTSRETYTKNYNVCFLQLRNSTTATASSGWTDDTASGHILHPSTSRCWWREGELGPSEYGNAGANPTPGSITCSAASRGSSIDDDTGYQTQSI